MARTYVGARACTAVEPFFPRFFFSEVKSARESTIFRQLYARAGARSETDFCARYCFVCVAARESERDRRWLFCWVGG